MIVYHTKMVLHPLCITDRPGASASFCSAGWHEPSHASFSLWQFVRVAKKGDTLIFAFNDSHKERWNETSITGVVSSLLSAFMEVDSGIDSTYNVWQWVGIHRKLCHMQTKHVISTMSHDYRDNIREMFTCTGTWNRGIAKQLHNSHAPGKPTSKN